MLSIRNVQPEARSRARLRHRLPMVTPRQRKETRLRALKAARRIQQDATGADRQPCVLKSVTILVTPGLPMHRVGQMACVDEQLATSLPHDPAAAQE